MEAIILKYWSVILGALGVTVWLVRLEGKVKMLGARVKNDETDIDDLKRANKEEIKEVNGKLDSMNIKLSELCISFAELSGYMKRCSEEGAKHGQH